MQKYFESVVEGAREVREWRYQDETARVGSSFVPNSLLIAGSSGTRQSINRLSPGSFSPVPLPCSF